MNATTLIANWKMHGNLAELRGFLHVLAEKLWQLPQNVNVIYCPPATHIAAAIAAKPPGLRVAIGGQSVSAYEKGAHTGEISAVQLADIGASYTLVGHSEERASRHLTDDDVAKAAINALDAGLVAVICIGETLAQYEAKRTLDVLTAQLTALTPALAHSGNVMIAYEPIWAIGTGKTPTLAEIEAAHAHIHAFIASQKEARDTRVPVLYGGSVKSSNAKEILALPSVNGALIGSASLSAEDFAGMVMAAA